MAQPQAYNRETDFTERDGDDTNHAGINTELDAAALSINELRDNLALIQRDDGALKNGIVTAESLSDSAFNAVLGEVATATAAASASADRSTLFATQAEADRIAAQAAAAAAQSSQTAAATSATAAASSQTAAANSASSASTSASTATTKANEASTSSTNSANSATAAANSATTAGTQATNAANSATASATSATNSATSATTATTQAGIATTQASNAAASATAAATSFDDFEDRYLGPKSAAPTVDNDGNPLLTGAMYFDTSISEMRVYTGTVWKAVGSAINGTTNRATYTATSGQTTFAIVYDVGFVDVYLNGLKLQAVAEFTATNGTSIVLATGATAGDVVDIVAYGVFSVADIDAQEVSFTQAGAGTVPRTVEDELRQFVTVKQFGAVGDGVTDDTAAIQAAINSITNTTFATTWSGGTRVYTKGGGTVFLPPGRYRVTNTLLLGQHVKLLGCSTAGYLYPEGAGVTGSVILSDFADGNRWIIDSANYDASGNRIPYRGNTGGVAIDAGTYNSTHGIEVENLYITRKAGTSAYGGVRLCGSPNSKLRNINVNGTDIGYMVNASWGVTAIQLQSQSYLYGFVALIDVNGIQIEGYFDAIAGKTIDSSNRLTGMYLDDFNATVGLPDWTNKRFGLLCYYNNATVCNRVITEGWDVARVYVQCKGVSENALYVERNSDAYLGVVSSDIAFNGMFQYNPSITTGYYFGYNADVTMTGMPVSNIGGTANIFTDIKINQIKADGRGWKYYDKVTFLGLPTGVIRVSATGSTTNIAYDSSYTTLDEALRRIENSPIKKWRVIIKDGDTVDMANHRRVDGKSITFEREGGGSNPTVRFVSGSGYPLHLLLRGDCDVRFQRVNIAYTASSSPGDAFDAAGLFIEQSASSTISLTFDNMTVDLQTGWYLLQQGYYSASTVQASFISCTINGSSNARIMGGAYGNEGQTNVISRQYVTTTAASIKAFGTNGWVNANVIASNF